MSYVATKAAARLRELRKRDSLSQGGMAEKLREQLPDMTFEGDTGKQTVSQLERGARGITIDFAFAYAEIFDVSLDFVLGRTDDWQPENKDIKSTTALPDDAIHTLNETRPIRQYYGIDLCSEFINNRNFWINMTSAIYQIQNSKHIEPPDGVENPLSDMFWIEPPVELFTTAGLRFYCQDAFGKFIESIINKVKDGKE